MHDLQIGTRASAKGTDAVGVLARRLREYFCKGHDCVMLRQENELMWFPAFAALSSRAKASTVQEYRDWVARVAHKEYADELIVAAAARELQVRIVVVPYTPRAALHTWRISEYNKDAVEEHPH